MSALEADYERLTRGAGHVVLGDWTIVRVQGADRATLLHNLCTADVARLQPGQGCEAFFTDVKGHVLAHAIVLCRPQDILLWTVPGQAGRLTSHIERYVIREDVAICDLSPAARLVVVAGQEVHRALRHKLMKELERPLEHATFDEMDAIVARCPWFGPSAFVCQVANEALEPLKVALVREGAFACGPAALEAVRIECGTPYFGVDFDASNLPQEVNRNDRAISFTKGCYLGQETVARIDALGHVNRLLVTVRFHGREVPALATALLDGEKEVGKVTSASWSPRSNAPLALAMVRRGHHEVGSTFGSAAGRGEVVHP